MLSTLKAFSWMQKSALGAGAIVAIVALTIISSPTSRLDPIDQVHSSQTVAEPSVETQDAKPAGETTEETTPSESQKISAASPEASKAEDETSENNTAPSPEPVCNDEDNDDPSLVGGIANALGQNSEEDPDAGNTDCQ